MRGHVTQRGKRFAIVVDVGQQAAQRCVPCGRRGLFWVEKGKRLERCRNCGGPLKDVVHRRQEWRSGFDKRKEADTALTELLGRLEAGTHIQPSRETVESFMGEWLAGVRSRVRPSTAASYRAMVESHVLPYIGSMNLQRLSAAALNALYADLLATGRRNGKGGLSPRSVKYVHTIIRAALSDAVRWNRVPRNVADFANPPRSRSPEMHTWSAEELRSFLAHVHEDRLFAAWRLAATTGLRRGELLGLPWSDVDLKAGRVAVQQTLISVGYQLVFSTPKTPRGRRSVALDPVTLACLKAHRKRQVEERLEWGELYQGERDLVFAREDGSPIHPDAFSKSFDSHAKAAGLPAIRLHDLRHSHASLALAAGIHPKIMSERLGHSSVAITMDTYSHAIPALQEEAAATVAALLE